MFGILLPIIVVVIDPYVFTGNGLLSNWSGAGYMLIAIGIGSMAYWLLRGVAHPFLAGIFAICSFLAMGIGIVLLPFSIIGIVLFGIGLLGFIPFGTAYVFCRGALDVWKQSSNSQNRRLKFFFAIVAVVSLLIGSQKTVDFSVDRAVAIFVRENGQVTYAERSLLIGAAPFGLQKHIVAAWRQEKDAVRVKTIAERYEAIYGTNIAHDEVLFFD